MSHYVTWLSSIKAFFIGLNGISFFRRRYVYKVTFSKECADCFPPNDYHGLNKLFGGTRKIRGGRGDLYGVTQYVSFMHGESDRFCWRPSPDKDGTIEIYAYPYRDGIRPYDRERSQFGHDYMKNLFIRKVLPEKEYTFLIEFHDIHTTYRVIEKTETGYSITPDMNIASNVKPSIVALPAKPYHGGQYKARKELVFDFNRP